MKDIVYKWINDAESFEFMTQYDISNPSKYCFIERQDDFYITLINRLYNLLDSVEDSCYTEISDELNLIAQGLLVYSEKASEQYFEFINKPSNQLYVASIYYLTGYEAVASYILKEYQISDFITKPSKVIYYIISGLRESQSDMSNEELKRSLYFIYQYFYRGDDTLSLLEHESELKMKRFAFSSVDDFFDTAIMIHVIKKLSKSNIRQTLYSVDSHTNWENYIHFSMKKNILSFLPSQVNAINNGLLNFEHAFSLKMPTSGGKSYITELVIYQELQRNKDAKILYLAPLRSLSRELKDNFKYISKELNFSYRAIYGGSAFTIDQQLIDESSLLISTPETFMSIEDSLDDKLSQFSLIICDEGQLLDSLERGINYELLLTCLKRIIGIRFLFLSAIIPNINNVNTWLGGNDTEIGDSNYRPCPIKLAVAKNYNDGIGLSVKDYTYTHEKFIVENFISSNDIRRIPKIKTHKEYAVVLALKSLAAGQTLIYTHTKGGNMGCASIGETLLSILQHNVFNPPSNWSSSNEELIYISDYLAFQLGDNYSLIQFIKKGFAFHHGSLPQNIRELIEKAYIKNIVPLLICTSTLAEGVNLPVHTIIPYNILKYNPDSRRMECIDATELKNILGRVGRAGKQQFGVIMVPDCDETSWSYKTIIQSLKSDKLNKINGTLYDIVSVLNKFSNNLDDNDINDILEKYGLASAIDLMLTKSTIAQSLNDVDVDEVVKDSLAYHIGTEDTRISLRKVFRIRKEKIEELVPLDKQNLILSTGLTAKDIIVVDRLISKDNLVVCDCNNPTSVEWISFILSIVNSMPSYRSPQIKPNTRERQRNIRLDEQITILSGWIMGKQYYEMANCIDCNIDSILDVISDFQSEVYRLASAVYRYISEVYNIDVSNVQVWCEMIKFGVDSLEKLTLIKSGLTDRILVNIFPEATKELNLNYEDPYILRTHIYHDKTILTEIVDSLHIPIISKRQFFQF